MFQIISIQCLIQCRPASLRASLELLQLLFQSLEAILQLGSTVRVEHFNRQPGASRASKASKRFTRPACAACARAFTALESSSLSAPTSLEVLLFNALATTCKSRTAV